MGQLSILNRLNIIQPKINGVHCVKWWPSLQEPENGVMSGWTLDIIAIGQCGDNVADVSPWASSQTSSALSLSLLSRSQHFHHKWKHVSIKWKIQCFYSKLSFKPIFCISADLFCILWNCKQLYETVRGYNINFVLELFIKLQQT